MEASAILQADSLDIIFENRNKDYGAYELRKHYSQRLVKSLLGMGTTVVLLLGTYFLMANTKNEESKPFDIKDFTLTKIDDPKKPPPPVVIPPPVQTPQVHTEVLTPPLIQPDDQVDEKEKPPTVADLDDAKIGLKHVDGDAFDGSIEAPVDERKGVVDVPKPKENPDSIFTTVEIESMYPGGLTAWSAFLNRRLVYPDEAAEQGKQGTVMVLFIVDTEGMVSNVEAVSGPEELRNAAVSVIRKSGKWEPAIQNGRKVKSYKRQPITFRLAE